ncbi:MAG: hypothetical protein ACP5OA_05805 [Candidatus Woesearchaeota archaeon]
MQSVSDITKVIIDDKPNTFYVEEEPQRYIPGKINLGVSKTNDVQYEWFDGLMKRRENSTLFLDNYHGKILLPKHCGIQILDSKRIISGLINFPAYLDSNTQINIMIDKESGLDLLVSTLGIVYLNGKPVEKIVKGDDPDKIPTIIGADFEEYAERYSAGAEKKKPRITNDQFGTTADFGYIDNYCLLDVCMKFNLVTIYTDNGDMSIFYENFSPDINRRSRFKILQSIRRSEHGLDIAYKSQDYIRVKDITKKLERLYHAIGKEYNKHDMTSEIGEDKIPDKEKNKTSDIKTINDIIQNHKPDKKI